MAKTSERRSAVVPAAAEAPERVRRDNWLLEFYRSALGKKYVMAVTGVIFMSYVLVHMIGNLKIYLGASPLNTYAEWLREMAYPALPHSGLLWFFRLGLLVSLVLHLHASWALTMMNRRARPKRYASHRDYVAANFAARTMRWSGIIVGLFIVFHLLDLTWGYANPDFVVGDVYHNVVASFQRWPVSFFYILANLALGLHLYHGAWSLFQSLGLNNRRFNHWRHYFAVAFAAVITLGNISFPLAVMTGVVA